MRRALSLPLAWVVGAALLAASPAATAQEIWRTQPGAEPAVRPGTEPAMEPATEPALKQRSGGGAQQPGQPRSKPNPYSPGAGSPKPYGGTPPVYDSPNSNRGSRPPVDPRKPAKPIQDPSPRVSPPSPGAPRRSPSPLPPVVAPGWPIKRPLNPVIVRPRYDDRHRHDDRHRYDDRYRPAYPYPSFYPPSYYYGRPFFYLPLVIFGGYYVPQWDDRYWHDRLLWEDAITIYGDEGWIEFTLDCGATGERLWIEVRDGRSHIDWAEIVFEDGSVQVVDFSDRSLAPGLYQILDFRGYYRVEYVRMVARASTREARLILRLER